MGRMEPRFDHRDTGESVTKNITDMIDYSKYFSGFLDELKLAKYGYGPDQEVLIDRDRDTKDKFKMADIIKAVESFQEYMTNDKNKKMFQDDPSRKEELIEVFVKNNETLSKNNELRQTAIRCAKNA